jgi:hypothetical protein
MDVGQERVEPRPAATAGVLTAGRAVADAPGAPPAPVPAPAVLVSELEHEGVAAPSRREQWREELRWPLLTYGGTRLALLVLAIVCDLIFGPVVPKTSIAHEIGNWDGYWYIRVATLGYPHAVSHAQTTLGFFPLYPMVMWLVSRVLFLPYFVSGLLVSLVGGFVATVLVQRLTTLWWGPETARKAVLLFCLFPGSIVFSMDYSEGLLIPLTAGCMLALHKRRWVLAGVLAGVATAIGPDALVLVAMCGAASLVQLWRYGWRDGDARRSLVAPILAPAGTLAFALFLKAWTGSFLASYTAQKFGWQEATTLKALPALLATTVAEVVDPGHLSNVNLNGVVGLLGAGFLFVGLRWLWAERLTIPIEVWVYVAAMTFLITTSAQVPPNPRMLITAFPVVLIFASRLTGRGWTRMVRLTAGSFVLLSTLTFVGAILRP